MGTGALMGIGAALCALSAANDAPWSAERAWDWYLARPTVRGCNYLPRTAVNTTEMWQAAAFDPKTIDEELGWAHDVGYNSVRVFLPYLVWEDDAAGLKKRVDEFLAIAARHGIGVVPVLFCDCSFAGREPYLGEQAPPVPGVHNSGWTPSPGLARVTDRSAWPQLEAYVSDLVKAFGRDDRVLLWDLYNEPGNSGMGDKSLPLVEAAFTRARAAAPQQPLTVGAWAQFDDAMSKRLMALSDVVSFHGYDDRPGLEAKITACAGYGRPVLCTECLFRQTRDNRFDRLLPLFAENRIGWFNWGLVAGRTQTYYPWGSVAGAPPPDVWQHDVLHPDGTPYDAAEPALIQAFPKRFVPRPEPANGVR